MDYKNFEMLTWLVSQLRKVGKEGITFDELMVNLSKEPNMNNTLSKRTFHSYLNELRERFGIKIECDNRLQYEVGKKKLSEENRRYRYYIVDEPKSDNTPWVMPFLLAFETSAVMRQLQDDEDYKRYMYIDCEPSGFENMNILLEAIRQQRCVDFTYLGTRYRLPYRQEQFEPRGLVMKDYVWYVLGHAYHHIEKIWPLNRLKDIKMTDIQYSLDPYFSPERFWQNNKKQWIDIKGDGK
jgi:hypothetical protein